MSKFKRIIIVFIIGIFVFSSNISIVEAKQPDSIEQFVTRLYKTVLNRRPDAGGLNYWITKIKTGQKSPHYVATDGFFHSKEFQNKKLSNEQFTTILYRTFLDRNPDSGGYKYWINKLNSGTSRDSVIYGFAESKEFRQIQQSYGIGQPPQTATKTTPSTNLTMGNYGHISIPSVGYEMKLSTGKGSEWQKIVDTEDSALYVSNFLGKEMLADHAAQGLKKMKSCKPGDKMIITKKDGTTTTYIMTTIYKNAVNNGSGILVGNKYADEMNDGDLFAYCCNNSSGKSVTVTFWKRNR